MRPSIWLRGLIPSWIDLLWGNHHVILCAPLKCAPGHVMVLGVGTVIKVHNRMAVMAIRLSRLIPSDHTSAPSVLYLIMKKGVGGLESAGD